MVRFVPKVGVSDLGVYYNRNTHTHTHTLLHTFGPVNLAIYQPEVGDAVLAFNSIWD